MVHNNNTNANDMFCPVYVEYNMCMLIGTEFVHQRKSTKMIHKNPRTPLLCFDWNLATTGVNNVRDIEAGSADVCTLDPRGL